MLLLLVVGRPRNQHLWRSRSSAKSAGVVGVAVAVFVVVAVVVVVLHVAQQQQQQREFRMTPLHLPVCGRGPSSGLAGIL